MLLRQYFTAACVVGTLVLTACGAPSTTSQPTSAPPAATAVPQVQAVAPTTAPTAAAKPTTAPATAPAAPTAPAAKPAESGGQGVTLVLDGASSQASYRARETLVGRQLPSEAVGTTRKVTGTIVLDPTGDPVDEQSKITVDLSALQSDEGRRDNFIKGQTLDTRQFPMATFVPKSVQGLPTPLPTSGTATFQLLGDLTVRGVTRPVTWDVSANFADGGMSGTATTTVQITDFGMTPPKAGPVLSIEDQLKLELVFAAARSS
jgi:polyisoprenoid-binding protein YceI